MLLKHSDDLCSARVAEPGVHARVQESAVPQRRSNILETASPCNERFGAVNRLPLPTVQEKHPPLPTRGIDVGMPLRTRRSSKSIRPGLPGRRVRVFGQQELAERPLLSATSVG